MFFRKKSPKISLSIVLSVGAGIGVGFNSFAINPECNRYSTKLKAREGVSGESWSSLGSMPESEADAFEKGFVEAVSTLTDRELTKEIQSVIDAYNHTLQGYVIGLNNQHNVQKVRELLVDLDLTQKGASKLHQITANLETVSAGARLILASEWPRIGVVERRARTLSYIRYFKNFAIFWEFERRQSGI